MQVLLDVGLAVGYVEDGSQQVSSQVCLLKHEQCPMEPTVLDVGGVFLMGWTTSR